MRDYYHWDVRVKAQDHLDDWVGEYLGELSLRRLADGTTRISGRLPDMPAVYGFILRLRDGGIPLLSLHIEKTAQQEKENLQ